MEIEVRGAQDLELLAKRLKAAGENDLRKELLRGIREVNKPVVAKIKANALETLPKRGGLAASVAKSKIGTRTKTSGKTVGVRIEAKNKLAIDAMDKGKLRHPVFGNRNRWVNQTIPADWFTGTVEADKRELQHAIQHVIADVASKIERGL